MDWTPETKALFETAVTSLQGRLLLLAERHLHPLLRQRLSAEDILQETLASAHQSPDYLLSAPDTPLYFKLRRLLFQTLADAERRHLRAQKRDLYREISFDLESSDNDSEKPATPHLHALAADISSPFTKVARQERYALLSHIMSTLPASDQRILVLRHFDNCTNAECAHILDISEKAASQRYVRALTRLQEHLTHLTEFTP